MAGVRVVEIVLEKWGTTVKKEFFVNSIICGLCDKSR